MEKYPTDATPAAPSSRFNLLTQVVLPLVIFVGVVGGTVYLWNFVGKGDTAKPVDTPEAKGEPLAFTEKFVMWEPRSDAKSPPYPGEFEAGTEGSYAFWFENKQAAPAELGLQYKSCNCTQVQVALLTPAEAQSYKDIDQFHQELQVQAACPGPLGSSGVLHLINFALNGRAGRDGLLGKSLRSRWQTVAKDQDGLVVEPAGAGLVRLSWDDKRGTDEVRLLKVEMWTQPQGVPRDRKVVPLNAMVAFVPPVQVDPQQVEIKDWTACMGQTEFVVWSSTRSSFPLRATAPSKASGTDKGRGLDPCVEPRMRPLTARECQDLEKAIEARKHVGMRVLSGYRVHVTVYQEKGLAQLEHGLFQRWVDLTSDASPAIPTVMVTGTVRGGVEIDNHGVLSLGSFKVVDGKTTSVMIWLDAGVELATTTNQAGKQEIRYHKNPREMEVRVEPIPRGDTRRVGYKLWVTVPRDAVVGSWPKDSAITLYTNKRGRIRPIRIPVEANPYG